MATIPERRRVRLIKRGDFWDYACATCGKVFPFYDEALDCTLGHKLERIRMRINPKPKSKIRNRFGGDAPDRGSDTDRS